MRGTGVTSKARPVEGLSATGVRIQLAPSELTLLGKTLLQLDEVGRILDPAFDTSASVRRNVTEIMSQRMRKGVSQGNVLSSLLEMKEFVTGLPARLNKILDAVSNAEDYNNIVANLHHTRSETWLTTYVDYDQWYLYETVQQAIRHYDVGMYPEQENRTAPVDTDAGKNLTWFFNPVTGTTFGYSGNFVAGGDRTEQSF